MYYLSSDFSSEWIRFSLSPTKHPCCNRSLSGDVMRLLVAILEVRFDEKTQLVFLR